MSAIGIDTLKFARKLKAAGVPDEQAEAQAEVLGEAFLFNLDEIVTRDYLDARLMEFESRFNERMDARFLGVDDRFESNEKRFKSFDERFESNEILFKSFEQRFDSVEERFESIDRRLDSIEERFESIDRRLESIETRFDSIDGRLESIEKRFDSIDGRLESIEKRFDSIDGRFNLIGERFKSSGEQLVRIEGQFRLVHWMLGLIIIVNVIPTLIKILG